MSARQHASIFLRLDGRSQSFKTEFVRKPPLAPAFVEVPVPEVAPIGELPLKRAVLTDGWLRVYQPNP
jgi:hypothetical protein